MAKQKAKATPKKTKLTQAVKRSKSSAKRAGAATKKKAVAKKSVPKKASAKRAGAKTVRAKATSPKKATRQAARKASTKKSAKKSVRKAVKKVAKRATKKVAGKPASKSAKPTRSKRATPRPAATKRAGASAASRQHPRAALPRHAKPSPQPAASERRSSGLSAKDVQTFRQMLIEKRAQLMGDVGALQDQAFGSSEHAGDESRMPLHMADLGSDNFEHEFTLGLIEGERAVLAEIEEALRRLDAGEYGVCLATGKPIGKARLRAKPWAKYCYEYTLAQEKGQERRL